MIFKKNSPSVKAQFKKFLKQYNCKFTDEVDKESGTWSCYFDFQGGHFVAGVKKTDSAIDVNYPRFHTEPMEHIQIVRAVCNRFNSNNTLFKFVYTYEPDEGEIALHASFFNNRVDIEEMAGQLSALFYFTRDFESELQHAITNAKNEDTTDVERHYAERSREYALMLQQEMLHEVGKASPQSDDNEQRFNITVGDLIHLLLDDDHIVVMELHLLTPGEQHSITTPSRILSYDLTRHLIVGRGKKAEFSSTFGELVLQYYSSRHEVNHLLTINIKSETADDSALYMRMTVTIPPYPASMQCSMDSVERQSKVYSSVIAYNRGSLKKQLQEADYMWKDAQLRIRDNQALTDEQKLLQGIEDPQVAYNAYWGRQNFIAGRYFRALMHYENLFNALKTVFYNLEKNQRRLFFDLCYDIGFCYNELGLYKQAYYYLQYLEDDGNVRHSTELANTLANSSDMRFFKFYNEVMGVIHENYPDSEDLPENIADFINFMRRRHAYTLIEFDKLDDAEKEFTEMLEEPDNSDYAIQELAYIKQLRRLQSDDDTTDEKPEKTTD